MMGCREALAELEECQRLSDEWHALPEGPRKLVVGETLTNRVEAAWEGARAALSAPDGWVLVPKEPTLGMLRFAAEAFYGDALRLCPAHTQEIRVYEFAPVYDAMLASAPPIEPGKP